MDSWHGSVRGRVGGTDVLPLLGTSKLGSRTWGEREPKSGEMGFSRWVVGAD